MSDLGIEPLPMPMALVDVLQDNGIAMVNVPLAQEGQFLEILAHVLQDLLIQ